MEANSARILLVEDDLNLGFLTMEYLESEGFAVKLCKDGESALKSFQEQAFDIGVFDVMLPRMDGFKLAEEIKLLDVKFPIIFLTAKNLKADISIGFKLGGDDYMTKPFDEEELLWRIVAVLKRTNLAESSSDTNELPIGEYLFQPNNQLLIGHKIQQRLTERETKVLQLLVANKGNITRRDELLENIWGLNDYFAGRSLDVFIAKLRKYLKADSAVIIENVPRVGFILKD